MIGAVIEAEGRKFLLHLGRRWSPRGGKQASPDGSHHCPVSSLRAEQKGGAFPRLALPGIWVSWEADTSEQWRPCVLMGTVCAVYSI